MRVYWLSEHNKRINALIFAQKRDSPTSPNTSQDVTSGLESTPKRRSFKARQADDQKVQAKDKEIDNLREKCQQLTDQLNDSARSYDLQVGFSNGFTFVLYFILGLSVCFSTFLVRF